jgi:hypothetical protein
MRFLSALRSPLALLSLVFLTVMGFGVATTACGVGGVDGEDQITVYIDTDGDGITDSVDTDGDGDADFTVAECPSCTPHTRVVCRVPLIDENRDGVPDGIDTNCDGKIDIRFDTTGGGQAGQGGRCLATSTVNGNKLSVSCTGAAGGGANCECRRNDQLIQRCTQTATVCSIKIQNGKVNAGCCVF